MTITRRAFMRGGALALVSFGPDPLFLDRAAYALKADGRMGRPADRRRTLVCLFQRGAVDGLNMVVPHGERLYYGERPMIAILQTAVLDLARHFGLHPA